MGNGDGFKLTPQEDFVSGVSMKRGELRFRPGGTKLALPLASTLIASIVGLGLAVSASSKNATVNGDRIVNPTPLHLLVVAMLAYVWLSAWNDLRSGVVANATHLRLRQGRRCVTIEWPDVHSIDAYDQDSDETTVAFGPAGVGTQPVATRIVGFVQTTDGKAIALPGVVSTSSEGGFFVTGAGKSEAETKIEALRRYAEHVTRKECPRATMPVHAEPMHTPRLVLQVAFMALFCASVFLATSVAIDRWTNPAFLVVGFAVYLGSTIWNRRKDPGARRWIRGRTKPRSRSSQGS